MKKTAIIFIICVLMLVSAVLWLLKGRVTGNIQEILTATGIFILVGFAALIGTSRLRSHLRKEPSEDELSKRVMTRASSLAFYVSLYLWLFISYMSERLKMPTQSLIGSGILGMALVFFFCWLYVKASGMKND